MLYVALFIFCFKIHRSSQDASYLLTFCSDGAPAAFLLEIFINSHRYGTAQHLRFVQMDPRVMLKVRHQSCFVQYIQTVEIKYNSLLKVININTKLFKIRIPLGLLCSEMYKLRFVTSVGAVMPPSSCRTPMS